MANGMRIGEILAADDLELQLPGIPPKKRKCWFVVVKVAAVAAIVWSKQQCCLHQQV